MKKIQKTIRVSQETIDMIKSVSDNDYNGNWTLALENMIKNSFAVMSIPEEERDKLRVSCRKGPYNSEYIKHERKMIDFFWV